MDDDLKAKLTLEAQATGGDELRAMAEQVRAMGQDAGASAPKLNALAAVLVCVPVIFVLQRWIFTPHAAR